MVMTREIVDLKSNLELPIGDYGLKLVSTDPKNGFVVSWEEANQKTGQVQRTKLYDFIWEIAVFPNYVSLREGAGPNGAYDTHALSGASFEDHWYLVVDDIGGDRYILTYDRISDLPLSDQNVFRAHCRHEPKSDAHYVMQVREIKDASWGAVMHNDGELNGRLMRRIMLLLDGKILLEETR